MLLCGHLESNGRRWELHNLKLKAVFWLLIPKWTWYFRLSLAQRSASDIVDRGSLFFAQDTVRVGDEITLYVTSRGTSSIYGPDQIATHEHRDVTLEISGAKSGKSIKVRATKTVPSKAGSGSWLSNENVWFFYSIFSLYFRWNMVIADSSVKNVVWLISFLRAVGHCDLICLREVLLVEDQRQTQDSSKVRSAYGKELANLASKFM